MKKQYPLKFTLENGTHVTVHKTADGTYDFTLTPHGGAERHFTYVDDDRPKTLIDESLDFDQLNAIRRLWLEDEEAD